MVAPKAASSNDIALKHRQFFVEGPKFPCESLRRNRYTGRIDEFPKPLQANEYLGRSSGRDWPFCYIYNTHPHLHDTGITPVQLKGQQPIHPLLCVTVEPLNCTVESRTAVKSSHLATVSGVRLTFLPPLLIRRTSIPSEVQVKTKGYTI